MSDPTTHFDGRFSAPDATATPWADTEQALEDAEVFWISTVRADGRPHVTPLLARWLDGALYFGTGPGEQKAVNLHADPRCILTTGANQYRGGLDVVVEGEAVRVTDRDTLQRLADEWPRRFGPEWQFAVADGILTHADGGPVHMFRLAATKAFAFAKGPFSQTTYRYQ